MFVAASTECFAQLPLQDALARLVDLEYSRVEIALDETGNQLKPSQVHENLEQAIGRCRETQRLTPVAYSVNITAEGQAYYDQFASCCKLATATKVVNLTIPSGELGTPFNGEVERLREMVRIATLEGVVLGLLTEAGKMTEDPETAQVLCKHVKGLRITLDPSHYIFNRDKHARYEPLLEHVCHVALRDTNKQHFQVRVGQGDIEYGRLVTQLQKVRYTRALSVHIADLGNPEVDHAAEMRKMRLLLESLL